MKQFLILAVLNLMLLTSCSENSTPSFEPESYSGELTVYRVDQVDTRTDTVTLVIDGSAYQLIHLTQASNLCNSSGTQSGFGSNSLTLTPTPQDITGCDNIRVPNGRFDAVFKDDSLTLGPARIIFTVNANGQTVNENWDYTFKLRKR